MHEVQHLRRHVRLQLIEPMLDILLSAFSRAFGERLGPHLADWTAEWIGRRGSKQEPQGSDASHHETSTLVARVSELELELAKRDATIRQDHQLVATFVDLTGAALHSGYPILGKSECNWIEPK